MMYIMLQVMITIRDAYFTHLLANNANAATE